MKKVLVIALAMLSLSAFAKEKANKAERLLLCGSIDKAMQAQAVEYALDMGQCQKAKISSELVSEGIRLLKGKIKFNSAETSFYQTCELAYEVEPKEENIFLGLDGINCK